MEGVFLQGNGLVAQITLLGIAQDLDMKSGALPDLIEDDIIVVSFTQGACGDDHVVCHIIFFHFLLEAVEYID